jgi:hypothetical protein
MLMASKRLPSVLFVSLEHLDRIPDVFAPLMRAILIGDDLQDDEQLSHYQTEPAARRLGTSHPDVAARVYRALGMRILTAQKSKYYVAALSHFENARRCYERAGLLREWEVLAADLRGAHHRKAGFMADFERLAAGHTPSEAPSFLERARRRWEVRAES